MKKEPSKNKAIIELMMKENDLKSCQDISNMFNNMFGEIVQTLLDAEMDDFIGYDKNSHDKKENGNRRNGVTSKSKKIKTDKGIINVTPPRDRDGEFEPMIIKKRQKVLEGMDEIVTAMYAKGLSLSDIKEMIKKLYCIELSKETLSNLTSAVTEKLEIWQSRKLKKCYSFVYVDCLYCPIKKDLISEKTAIYVMLGIDLNGKKEVLGIWIDSTESATFWNGIFEEVKSRGVEEILFVSMDGLKGLPEAIEKIFPKTITQRCIVHLVRNIYSILGKKECKEVIADFKKIYTAPNKIKAELEYEGFLEKYKDNAKLIKKVKEYIEHIYQLFEYPKEIQKIIYTTNPIESLNSALRKVTKGKGSFINKDALLKVLYLRIEELEKKWSKGTAGWEIVRKQLGILFEDRLKNYL